MAYIQGGRQSRQKVTYISHALGKRGKGDYIEITYKKEDGTEAKTGAFVAALDEASKTLIKAGGQFVIVKTKAGDYWNLTKVEDVSTYVAKAPYTPRSNSGGGNTGGSTYNTAGVKVGAVLHDSVALAGQGATIETVKVIAEQLLNLSYELEANVNAGKYSATNTTTTLTIKDVPVGNLEEIKF